MTGLPTVIVPVFNALDALDTCLASLSRTLPANAVVLIADDASTDPNVEPLARHWCERSLFTARYIRRPINLGFPGNCNAAFAEAGEVEDVPIEAMIDREPLTIICSKMGWIRAMKGHQALDAEVKFKDGDEGRFILHAETTDRILLVGSNGRFYTLLGANLPGGRGMGEPVRLLVDLPNEADIVDLLIYRAGEKFLVASTEGDGFIVPADEVVAQTRAGNVVLNLRDGVKPQVCR